MFCPFSDSIKSPTLMPSTYALLLGLICRKKEEMYFVVNLGSLLYTDRLEGVDPVAGCEFV